MIKQVKLRSGKYLKLAQVIDDGTHLHVKFPYDPVLLEDIKAMAGRKFHSNEKNINPIDTPLGDNVWSFPKSKRNLFQWEYLTGGNPYAPYEKPIVPITDFTRPLRQYQKEDTAAMLTYKRVILAAEQGTGKSLTTIEAMERTGKSKWWYVGPRSAILAVERELKLWKSSISPTMMTYEGLVARAKNFDGNMPDGIWCDECQKCKTPTSQRGQATKEFADNLIEWLFFTSGTPAPKSPADWWWLLEIICPGFLKEGTLQQFRARLSVLEKGETPQGSSFMQHLTWKDDENKCDICGELRGSPEHDIMQGGHSFKPSKNEVAALYRRMKGPVIVRRKKDVLKELPDKQFRIIDLPVSQSTKRMASLIASRASTTIEALTHLRELSDGFQYEEVQNGMMKCQLCEGTKKALSFDENGSEVYEDCPRCEATGEEPRYQRVATRLSTPKEQLMIDLLEEFEDTGRFVIYAAFQDSVDRCVDIAIKQGWSVIRADGRGWMAMNHERVPIQGNFLEIFQDQLAEHPKVVFIGQAGAAGTGLTLTASPAMWFYSLSFNGDDYFQAMDRIHRLGMDINKGATIIHGIHLPSDRMVLDNVTNKDRLLKLTLGEVQEALVEQDSGPRSSDRYTYAGTG